MKHHAINTPLCCLLVALMATACSSTTLKDTRTTNTSSTAAQASDDGISKDDKGCLTAFDDKTDYFPDKVELRKATNFSVDYRKSYAVVTVNEPFQGAPKAEKYVLYPCGAPKPELSGETVNATLISTPITSMFSGSTTQLPLLVDLGHADLVTGVGTAKYVSNPEIRQRIDAGKVVEYSPAQSIDTEKVIAANPSLIMAGGTDAPEYKALKAAGVPVVYNAEWLEKHPLGRAEWIKFMGLLVSVEAKANSLYSDVSAKYNDVVKKASDATGKPTVLPGQMFKGEWYMPGGDSYVAALLKDANATYPWSDLEGTGSQKLTLEDVLAKGQKADVWISSARVQKMSELTDEDSRYAEFQPFTQGNVWSNNKAMGPTGGNEYWERGVTRPDIILSDLVSIIHPDLMQGYETEFYRKLDK